MILLAHVSAEEEDLLAMETEIPQALPEPPELVKNEQSESPSPTVELATSDNSAVTANENMVKPKDNEKDFNKIIKENVNLLEKDVFDVKIVSDIYQILEIALTKNNIKFKGSPNNKNVNTRKRGK